MAYGVPAPVNKDTFLIVGILVVLFGFLGFAGLRFFGNASGSNKEAAERDAAAYAKELHLQVTAISCAHDDSDGDDYVSCTLAVVRSDGTSELEPIECAVRYTTNSGCRLLGPRGLLRNRR